MLKRLVSNLREKKEEKEKLKPKYFINQLYVGELIYLEDKKFAGPKMDYTYRVKKKFVILTLESFATFRHIKSNQIIRSTLMAPAKDFAIHNDKKIYECCPMLLRKLDLDEHSKISYNLISTIEDYLNHDTTINLEDANDITF